MPCETRLLERHGAALKITVNRLEGLNARHAAGPFRTKPFPDCGADVIKAGPPDSGDPT